MTQVSSFTNKVVKSAVLILRGIPQSIHLDNDVDICCFYLTNFSCEIEREMEKNIGKKSMNEPIASAVRQTMTTDDPIIQVLNMSNWYGEFNVLRNINLEVWILSLFY